MKYFHTSIGIRGFELDGSQDFLICSGDIQLTDAEVAELYSPKSRPELVHAETSAAARTYLAETDWYCIRHIETGEPIPVDITAARQAARAAITG